MLRHKSLLLQQIKGAAAVLVTLSLMAVNLPVAQAATADKHTVGGTTYQPGQTATIEIAITKPTGTTTITPIEVNLAVDLSGSVDSQIEDTKTKLLAFTNQLENYYGLVRVGIYKFGSGIGGFNPQVITAANIANLRNAINSLQTFSNTGTSDITQGIVDANNGFTTATTKKFLVLQTDGYANHPYTDGGRCPVNISNGGSASSGARIPKVILKSTSFTIVPVIGAATQYTTKLGDSAIDPTNNYDPCGGTQWSRGADAYVSWRYGRHINNSQCLLGEESGQGTPACELLLDMRNVYPNASLQPTVNPALSAVIDEAKKLNDVKQMTIKESLNSAVFDSTAGISNVKVVKCGTSTPTGSSVLTPVGLNLNGTITVTDPSVSQYCLQFTVTIKNDPAVGTQPINTTGNTVTHQNGSGSTMQVDTITTGTITINDPYVAPTNLQVSSPTCNTATVSWSAGSATITNYSVILTPNTGNLNPRSAGTATSLSLSGLAASTSYTWQLIPTTASQTKPAITGPSFTTPACRSFDTSLPAGTIIQPGGGEAVQNVNLTYSPSQASWGNSTLTIKIVGIVPSTTPCSSAYTTSSPAVMSGSGSASGISAKISESNPANGQITFAASSSSPTITLQADNNTAKGMYNLCVVSTSANGTAITPLASQVIEVRNASWLQIGSTPVSKHAGDVHSNGNLTYKIPVSQYFYTNNLAGLVSAATSSSAGLSITPSRLSNLVEWRLPMYTPPITSPDYAQLLKTARSNNGEPQVRANDVNGSGINHIAAMCAAKTTQAFRVAANLNRDAVTTMTPANCPDTNLVYFIDGNLTISQNIINTSNTSSLTYIVQGNITVAATVTQIDAMLIFGGTFHDGAGTNQLTINGSVIGLASSSPTSAAGTFIYNSQSGLQRDLGSSNNNPAEIINYQPKFIVLLSKLLGGSSISWREGD